LAISVPVQVIDWKELAPTIY